MTETRLPQESRDQARKSRLFFLAQKIQGWQIWVAFVLVAIALSEVLVISIEWYLRGVVPGDFILTGFITPALVAPSCLYLLRSLVNEFARHEKQAVMEAEFRLKMAAEAAQMVFWELDFTTGELRFDDTEQRWLGTDTEGTAHTIPGWLEFIHPEDRTNFMAKLEKCTQQEGAEFDFEYRIKHRDGGWTWVQSRGRVTQRGADGQPILAAGGSLNISARKQIELDLQQSEILLRSTLESTDEGILMVGEQGQILSSNPRFLELWRIPKAIAESGRDERLLEHVLNQLSEPAEFLSLVQKLYNSNDEARDTLHFKDGRVFSRYTRALWIGQQHGRIWCFKDISEISQVQRELKESNLNLELTLKAITDLIFEIDQQGRFFNVYANQDDLLYVRKADILGKTVEEILPPPAATTIMAAIRDTELAGHSRGQRIQLELPSGTHWFELSSAIKLHSDTCKRFVMLSRDITDRVIAEQSLRLESEKNLALLRNASDGIHILDADGNVIEASDSFCHMLGYERSEVIGMNVEIWDAKLSKPELEAIVKLQLSEPIRREFETQHRRKDGSIFEVEVSGYPLELAGRKVLFNSSRDITARKKAEAALLNSEERAQGLANLLRLVSDNVPDMIWAKDLDKRYLFANKAICEQLLNATDTTEPIGKDDLFFALRERGRHPDNPEWHTFGELCQDSDTLTLQRGEPSQFDEFGNIQGKFLFLDVHKAPLLNEKGKVIGVVGSARDVTAQKSHEERLRLASLVLENSSEALLVTDADNRIVDINPAFTRLTGYCLDEVAGKDPSILHSGLHQPDFYQTMWQQIHETGHWQGEIWNRRKNGETYVEWLTINTIRHDDGSVHRRVALFSDITEKKKAEELVWTHANFDQLTQLPNRRMFHDRLDHDLKKAHRTKQKLALMFLDLDRFKEVNDTLGHDTGDALLVEAAQRISACVRESDTVARLGGDEFTIILPELNEPGCVERIAEEILHALAQPYQLGREMAYVSASLGITLYPDDSSSLEGLLKNADQAMYVAKNAGRNRFSYFTNAMQEAAQYRLHLLNDMRSALAEQQFRLHYQPIVELATGKVHKAEALLRWFHPKRGLISPAEFIPLAEDSGLIHSIGNWVFAQAAKQALSWRRSFGDDFQISVNKSPVQIQARKAEWQWHSDLAEIGLPGQSIVVEITEGLLLDTSPTVVSELIAYRDAGIQVAIDDFGTGYSSLSYLKKMDIDYVKIDQSFTRNLAPNSDDMALTVAIIMMAHKLGLKVIAEGVETEEQQQLLRSVGCDYAQGYLYSRPVPADEFEKFMSQTPILGLSR